MTSSLTTEYALRQILQNNAAFLAAIGGMDKVYTAIAPQNAAAPFAVLLTEDVSPRHTKREVSDYDIANVDMHVFAATHTALADIQETARRVLDFHSGIVIVDGETYELAHIEFATATNGGFNPESELYQFTVRYSVHVHRQTDISMASAFVFASDTAALNGDVSLGAIYELSQDNIYGMPEGTHKRLMNP